MAELLKSEGPQCLPLVLADGKIASKGSYASNDQLQTILKGAGFEVELAAPKKASCGCGPKCC